jgi:hypothetical protein
MGLEKVWVLHRELVPSVKRAAVPGKWTGTVEDAGFIASPMCDAVRDC